MFGTALDLSKVTVRRRKWFVFQPRRVAMTPRGHIHFHPASDNYCDDFVTADWGRKGLLIHELTHAWQTQQRGEWYLVLHRHPWCRYAYSLKPGWKLEQYGIEQQAEIVRHAFLLRHGVRLPGVGDPAAYDKLVNFPGAR
ncbi:MAG: vgr related protein [Croceibacterium sp.]